jgi:hypothetical protein
VSIPGFEVMLDGRLVVRAPIGEIVGLVQIVEAVFSQFVLEAITFLSAECATDRITTCDRPRAVPMAATKQPDAKCRFIGDQT